MMLVIRKAHIRRYKIHAVEKSAVSFLNRHAAANCAIQKLRFLFHPSQSKTLSIFIQFLSDAVRLCGKPRGKHLRKDKKIRSSQRIHYCRIGCGISLGIRPNHIAL